MNRLTFQTYVDSQGQYRWRLVSGNGETIADCGQGYSNATDRDHAIGLMMAGIANAEIEALEGAQASA